MACWLQQPTTSNEFCDDFESILKQEQQDNMLFEDNLQSGTPFDIDIDPFSNILDTSPTNQTMPPTTTTTDFSQPINSFNLAVTPRQTYPINMNSQTNSTASAYSSLGISPKFTTLSINQHQFPFSPSSQDSINPPALLQAYGQSSATAGSNNSLHPSPYVQQQNNAVPGPSFSLEFQVNPGASDVKRFRSASMNEGATQYQETKIDPTLFDQTRLRSASYMTAPCYQGRITSSTNTIPTTTTNSSTSSLSTDVSSNAAWPYAGYTTRPPSSSFSEVLDHQQQVRLNNNLSTSYSGGLSPFYPRQPQRNQTILLPDLNLQPQQATNRTLYSLNQSSGDVKSPSTSLSVLDRKPPSLVDFTVNEIKDESDSRSCTIEQQSEGDGWSDVEQNSIDPAQDNDFFGDESVNADDAHARFIAAASIDFNSNSSASKSAQNNSNISLPFWQYNVQAKGPKTKRMLYLKERDPHLHREFSDPVYQIKLTQAHGQTLTKLRKGDGNDVTPNPVKLYQLGTQIRNLTSLSGKPNVDQASVYHGIYEEQTTNSNDTSEVKKEKNKIASRACRLRKKAQHEANKLKLHGLNEEHKTLIDLIASIKLIILKRFEENQHGLALSSKLTLEAEFDRLIADRYLQRVAGNSDIFVQEILRDMEHTFGSKQQRSNSLFT